MKALFRNSASLGLILALSTIVSAKGLTTRIVIASGSEPPIELTDPEVIAPFVIWSGPGTFSCDRGRDNCPESTTGFIADWQAGADPDRRPGLPRFEVSFYTRGPRDDQPERLAYVVAYEYDASSHQGFVYLPGRDESGYTTNSATLTRNGRDGHWFHATADWQNAVTSFIVLR